MNKIKINKNLDDYIKQTSMDAHERLLQSLNLFKQDKISIKELNRTTRIEGNKITQLEKLLKLIKVM